MNGRELGSPPACVLWSLVKCGSFLRRAGEGACGGGDNTQGCKNNSGNVSSMEAIITGLLRSRCCLLSSKTSFLGSDAWLISFLWTSP